MTFSAGAYFSHPWINECLFRALFVLLSFSLCPLEESVTLRDLNTKQIKKRLMAYWDISLFFFSQLWISTYLWNLVMGWTRRPCVSEWMCESIIADKNLIITKMHRIAGKILSPMLFFKYFFIWFSEYEIAIIPQLWCLFLHERKVMERSHRLYIFMLSFDNHQPSSVLLIWQQNIILIIFGNKIITRWPHLIFMCPFKILETIAYGETTETEGMTKGCRQSFTVHATLQGCKHRQHFGFDFRRQTVWAWLKPTASCFHACLGILQTALHHAARCLFHATGVAGNTVNEGRQKKPPKKTGLVTISFWIVFIPV